MRGQTLRLQLFEDGDRLPLRPNHTDIARWSLHRPAQHAHIVAVPARDAHDVRRLAGCELRRGLVYIFRHYLLRFGKAFAICVSFAHSHHPDLQPTPPGILLTPCPTST